LASLRENEGSTLLSSQYPCGRCIFDVLKQTQGVFMKKTVIFLLAFWPLTGSAAPASEPLKVDIKVTEKGFEPNSIDVETGRDLLLEVTRTTDSTCSTSIQIPSQKIKKELPLNKTVEIKVGKLKKGEIRFGCGMNMMEGGKIFVR
jgi:plastocyanin domain-containing protein